MKPYQLKIEWKDPASLTPYPMNAKAHPEAQIDKVAGSIAAFGFDQPIVVDEDGVILKGHCRLLASKKLGLKKVPVLVRTDLTEAEKKACRIADNRTAESEWFPEFLALELKALEEMDFDLSLTGFDLDELEGMGIGQGADPPPEDPGSQIDRASELQGKWATALGQIWQVGRHRVMCGDSTSAEDVGRLMDGAIPNLMVTDPPYGVEYDPAWRVEAGVQKRSFNSGLVKNDNQAAWLDAWKLSGAEIVYIWHASTFTHVVAGDLVSAGFELKYLLIWNKDLAVFGRGSYHWKHEPCWFAIRPGCSQNWIGDRKQSTVWDIPTIHSFANGKNAEEWKLTGHGTQKPVECMARPIRNHEGDVYDPFLGSGTTLIAAEQLGRVCYGMEIAPEYVAVILERASGVGLEPKLISTQEA